MWRGDLHVPRHPVFLGAAAARGAPTWLQARLAIHHASRRFATGHVPRPSAFTAPSPRDGVDEGQFAAVLQQEYKAIREVGA